MKKLNLESLHKALFKDENISHEIFKEINRAHVISSSYYEVKFSRNTIVYKDNNEKLIIPIEHNTAHETVIYINYFVENNKFRIDIEELKNRISNALTFLKINYCYE
jgi:hypothetical protein